jgi:hypothetical protein
MAAEEQVGEGPHQRPAGRLGELAGHPDTGDVALQAGGHLGFRHIPRSRGGLHVRRLLHALPLNALSLHAASLPASTDFHA